MQHIYKGNEMKEIMINGDKYIGKTLREALVQEGVELPGTCGGMGTCGKCKAMVDGREVLACKHQIREDVTVKVEDCQDVTGVKERELRLPEGFVCDEAEPGTYGIALDLGTTTVVVMLWDLHRGVLADMEAVSNPQRFYGGDVMARISFVLRAPWNLKRLQSSLVNEVNQAIGRLTMRQGIKLGQIRKIAAVGNTTMSHLFLGEDVRGLAGYPFQRAFQGALADTHILLFAKMKFP